MQVTCLHIIVLAVSKHDVAYIVCFLPSTSGLWCLLLSALSSALSVDTAQRFLLVTFNVMAFPCYGAA